MSTPIRSSIAALGICLPLLAGCGGTGAGASPSTAAPPASGGGPSTPTPPPSGSSALTVTPSSIQGQGQPQATVTIANAAPDGGALVVITSSNTAAARVPATVTVAAGSRSVTFVIDTSTVSVVTPVTITASYAGTVASATLSVTSPILKAGFVVRSRTRGPGVCVVEDSTQEFDCLLDGSSSTGFISTWTWTYTAGTSTLGHTSKDAGSGPQISTKCAFLNTATGGDGANGDRFLNLEVTLQVQDAAGIRSDIVRQAVRLYPNRQCGFSY